MSVEGATYTRRVDARTLGLLELPAILERLAGAAASEPGRALALALAPSPDPAEVERRISALRGRVTDGDA